MIDATVGRACDATVSPSVARTADVGDIETVFPQTLHPLSAVMWSDDHWTVVPAATNRPLGPEVPEKFAPPILRVSQQAWVSKTVAVKIVSLRTRKVHRSLFP